MSTENLTPTQQPSVEALKKEYQKLLDDLTGVSKRPKGWSKKSNPPYYKEAYAQELVKHLEKFLQQPPDKPIYFIESKKVRLSPIALYTRYNQAWLYLRDHLDPTGKWAALRSEIEIRRTSSGVIFAQKRIDPRGISVSASDGEAADALVSRKWKQELEDFVANAIENEKFEKSGLKLTEEDMQSVRNSLMMLGDMHIIKLKPDKILVVKCSNISKD